MASSVYSPKQERQHHSINLSPVILRESKAQHKELVKTITLCKVTKDDARQGHFHLESVCFLSTISIQTPALSRYAQIPIFLQIHLILDSTHSIKTKIGENVNQSASSLLILQMRQLPSESLTDLSRAELSNNTAIGHR